MLAALREAGLTPGLVDYVNAHATSTPLGDAVEGRALGALFGCTRTPPPGAAFASSASLSAAAAPRHRRVAVSSCKGSIGHLLGAAGAVEAIFTILALDSGRIPPTLNLSEPDAALPHDVCEFVGAPQQADANAAAGIRVALKNSFGFGGVNASIVFVKDEGAI
jgi:3-oxoacyl-[acyl-carrier-protein] synthase II